MVTEGCSDPHIKYWFDPKKEFNLGDIPVDELYSDKLKNALNTYHKASNALYYIFIIAFVTTIVEILAGIGAIFSRWGSFFTTLVSLVSHILMFLKKEMAMSFMLLTSSQSGCRRLHHCSRRLRLRHVPDHQRRNQPWPKGRRHQIKHRQTSPCLPLACRCIRLRFFYFLVDEHLLLLRTFSLRSQGYQTLTRRRKAFFLHIWPRWTFRRPRFERQPERSAIDEYGCQRRCNCIRAVQTCLNVRGIENENNVSVSLHRIFYHDLHSSESASCLHRLQPLF